jgi:hypothetical protein
MKLPSNTFDQNSHPNNELLDLLGYGLAKFNSAIISEFGFSTKIAFYQYFVDLRIAETIYVIKNRQDHFDPFFDNGRKGWWQDYDTYKHRKDNIDITCGNMNVTQFAIYIKGYIAGQRFTSVH